MRRLRIPTKDEILIVLGWGGLRLVLAGGELFIYSWKQISRLSLHCATGLERIYQEALIRPHQALLWNDLEALPTLKQIEQSDEPFELFRWERFKEEPDSFPHIRLIAKSGMGKTTLARYLLHLLGGKQCVITPKAKPSDWIGLEVLGKGFNYDEIETSLQQIKQLMYSNYELIDQSLTPEMANVALDEWRLTKQNVDCAGELVKEFITVARDAKIRLIALAQGEQVETWGLKGESDLGECFTDIRMGEFAIDYAKKIKASRSVLDWLQRQKRPCLVGRYPAEIPNLSSFQFQAALSPIERPEQFLKTPETTLQSELQRSENSQNGVLDGAEILRKAYMVAKTNGCSDSDFIKQVWGASRYSEGRAIIESWKN